MTAQDLKNAILQLAVQGKLVPQDPNDEPASELLKRIKAEKEHLKKEGKIKKDKPLAPISDDEIPFEIPESWEWVRHNELFEVSGGAQPDKSKFIPFPKEGYIRLYQTRDYGSNPVPVYIPEDTATKRTKKGDLLLARYGASLGKVFFAETGAYNVALAKSIPLYSIEWLIPKYVYYYYQSSLYQRLVTASSRSAQAGFNKEDLIALLFPLPPLVEQKRIVAKIEELMPLVEEYGKAEERLTALNDEFPDKLRKSILQQAIQGKLTERDPADEPASELLKRIRAEKERLIKEGKIKKEKPLPPITEEEMPFEIPDGWAVIRIGEVGVYKKGPFGSSITKNMFVPKGPDSVKVYEQKNAIQKDHTLGEYYIRRSYFNEKMRGFEVFPGDVIVSCAGTIGETYVMPDGIEQGIINQALMRMKIVPSLNLDYFLLYFDYVLKKSAQGSSKGSAIKNIPPFDVFKKMVLPLPPLAEQQRIVDRVNELLAVCDELK